MLYYYLFFFFIAFGSKLILAMAMIYLLLPQDRSCSRCDGETLLVRPSLIGRLTTGLSFGRIEWRWCPSCGQESLSRRVPPPQEPQHRVAPRARTRH